MKKEQDIKGQQVYTRIGHDAMRLAMTLTLEEENKLKENFALEHKTFVVTEVGGSTAGDFQERVNRAIVGAAFNENIIEKNPWELHALMHAAEEAKSGMMINSTADVNLAAKIAIVREEHWIAVAMFGVAAIHPLTNHERCGLGVMHI